MSGGESEYEVGEFATLVLHESMRNKPCFHRDDRLREGRGLW